MYKIVNSAKDNDGNIIKVNDLVEMISIYTHKLTGQIVKVIQIHKQGYDGTILTCDKAVDPDTSKYHNSGRAKYFIKRG